MAINNDGSKVKIAKEIMYFLFAIDPLTLMLFLIELLISIKINKKKKAVRKMLEISNNCKLSSFNLIKLFSKNVKKVINANESEIIKIIIINKFLFNKDNII